jgi:hypothetical protein
MMHKDIASQVANICSTVITSGTDLTIISMATLFMTPQQNLPIVFRSLGSSRQPYRVVK